MAAESGLADAVRAINNLATAQVRKDTPSLIDVKGLGFTGREKDFQQWSKKTEAFFAGVIKESEMMLLERAAEQPTEITTTAIDLWIQPSSLGIVPVLSLSDRIQLLHKLSVFTPPTAPLQCLGGGEGGRGGGGVKSNGLTCTCIVENAWSASPTCCRRQSQISKSRCSRRLDPSTHLVRKLTRSPSRLSLASPSAWKTSCLHSKRIMHGRGRAAMRRH